MAKNGQVKNGQMQVILLFLVVIIVGIVIFNTSSNISNYSSDIPVDCATVVFTTFGSESANIFLDNPMSGGCNGYDDSYKSDSKGNKIHIDSPHRQGGNPIGSNRKHYYMLPGGSIKIVPDRGDLISLTYEDVGKGGKIELQITN